MVVFDDANEFGRSLLGVPVDRSPRLDGQLAYSFDEEEYTHVGGSLGDTIDAALEYWPDDSAVSAVVHVGPTIDPRTFLEAKARRVADDFLEMIEERILDDFGGDDACVTVPNERQDEFAKSLVALLVNQGVFHRWMVGSTVKYRVTLRNHHRADQWFRFTAIQEGVVAMGPEDEAACQQFHAKIPADLLVIGNHNQAGVRAEVATGPQAGTYACEWTAAEAVNKLANMLVIASEAETVTIPVMEGGA